MGKNFIHRHEKAHIVTAKSNLNQHNWFGPRHKGLKLYIHTYNLLLKFRSYRLALYLETLKMMVF